MMAGRSSWLCHGTMPPGWMTSSRRRRRRSARLTFSFASSTWPSTVSVTSFGFISPLVRAPGLILSAGHWPACEAHQPLAAVFGVLVGMAAEEGCDLRLDGLRQQGSGALAQNFGQRVGELGWLDQLDDSILGHGVSLLRWRSGGLEHPHDTPPHPSRRHQLPRIPRRLPAPKTLHGSETSAHGGADAKSRRGRPLRG